jgi:hypothetical protein
VAYGEDRAELWSRGQYGKVIQQQGLEERANNWKGESLSRNVIEKGASFFY